MRPVTPFITMPMRCVLMVVVGSRSYLNGELL
jgi:hypothetical protein